MKPNGGGEPTGDMAGAISQAFGSFDTFKTQFNDAGAKRFGSGWAWLVYQNGKLAVTSHRQPGQPVHGRRLSDHGQRRLGARLLSEVPEPPPRLPRRLVERGQLGRDQQALPAGQERLVA